MEKWDTASSSESEAACYLYIPRRIYAEITLIFMLPGRFDPVNPVFTLLKWNLGALFWCRLGCSEVIPLCQFGVLVTRRVPYGRRGAVEACQYRAVHYNLGAKKLFFG